MTNSSSDHNKYVGMWVTVDGRIRHERLADGRYDEARGDKKSAYQGRYWLEGNHIEYVDDTGFTADGEFRDGVLYHAGMVLYVCAPFMTHWCPVEGWCFPSSIPSIWRHADRTGSSTHKGASHGR